MSLKLVTPAADQSPNMTVEVRPRQVAEWLDRLPKANLFEASRTLRDALSALNRQKLGEDVRLKLLELYRASIMELLPGLEQQLAGAALPLPEKQRQIALLARELLVELAYGYKIILLDEINRLISFGSKKQLPQVIQRALSALGRILAICYQTYAPTPAGIWSEMHQLYRYAVQHSLQEEAVPDGAATTSVNLAYKQALMLALADPYRLMQGEVATIMDFLAHFGDQAHLMPLAQISTTHGFFLVRTESDKPPKAMAQNATDTDARSDILLNTLDLARAMHQKIGKLESGETPASLGLPESAGNSAYLDLLRRLLRHWGIAPKRHFNRVPNQAGVDICAGLRAVHHFLSGEKPCFAAASEETQDAEITLQVATSAIDRSSQQTFSSSKWVIANESAGGLALSKASEDPVQIRVGDLIGLKPENGASWNVGVVRWVKSDSPEDLELGVQMLAPNATPVAVKPVIASADAVFEMALLLPELPIVKQPATLLAPRGAYQGQREFQLDQEGQLSHVRATRLLEQTASFEQFQFTPS
jgi:hypothetical protein